MILLTMIFLHIIDDYCLQGILAQMKQKKIWDENAPNPLYQYDFVWALLMHAFSWTFMIMLPIAFTFNFNIDASFILMFVWNVLFHAYVDNEKANKFTINLWEDQLWHMLQIVLTYIIFMGV